MFREGKPQRNREGQITKAASYQSREVPKARVEPNRKWFTNTRVIGQETLRAFRQAVEETSRDPHQVLLKTNKLPMSLIRDSNGEKPNGLKVHRAKAELASAPFATVFGPKAQRKRVKMQAASIAELVEESERKLDAYVEKLEEERLLSGRAGDGANGAGADDFEDDGHVSTAKEPIFNKGQSKRIWNELYKVIDSSDVVIHVLDARDPLGTRCRSIEKYLREEAPHKHLIFVLNKCDLVPTSVAVSNLCRYPLSTEARTDGRASTPSAVSECWCSTPMILVRASSALVHNGRRSVTALGEQSPGLPPQSTWIAATASVLAAVTSHGACFVMS